ncbi:hypothetical protein CAPTEDRAFT_193357 [Capitella teleta]|uniref:Uncharacterized protein n=1 Tax=Capitella teleta TaxID=283909 RepID=R7UU89_CAPTE|nr:hypothetical protein CAPTEDRAFT_193357 [Capitella teleta]|eukprot:ELU10054.1 hypothetical protein CAPTEDRAFT_193357 [Capitella teleta]
MESSEDRDVLTEALGSPARRRRRPAPLRRGLTSPALHQGFTEVHHLPPPPENVLRQFRKCKSATFKLDGMAYTIGSRNDKLALVYVQTRAACESGFDFDQSSRDCSKEMLPL